MKKLLVAIAAMLIAGSAFAQVGIIAGVTSSKTDFNSAIADAGNITQYHVGVAAKIPLFAGFQIQPALIYNIKGMKLEDAASSSLVGYQADLKTGFVEVPVQIQWGFDLSAVRPYVFVEPFVGYAITNETKEELKGLDPEKSSSFDVVKNRLEYGFGVGAGVDLLDNLQLSVRYFWNMGELYKDNVSAITSVQSAIDAAVGTAQDKTCNGIMASLAIFF